jgi:pilus assembly protein CpaE
MQAYIVSNLSTATNSIREVLVREGHDCPANHLLSLEDAANRLAQSSPEMILVVLSPDADAALAALTQFHHVCKAPILAIGPASDSRLVLRTLRNGAADFIDEGDLESDLPAALHRLHDSQSDQAAPARTIAVLSPSGGCGSSTIAVNIATVLAKEHKSALLMDLKLQAGDLVALLDLLPTHTLAELCQHASRMDRVMLERSLVKHSSGVSLLAPPRSYADASFVTAEGIRQTLSLARNLFPYVIMDLDHSFREEQIQAIRQSDIVLVVLRLDFTCLRNTRRTLDYLRELGVNRERVRVVVNRHGQAQEVPAAKAEEALGMKIFHFIPDDPKTINRANNNGVPVVLESPWAKVSKSVSKLAASVNGRHA